MDTYICDKPEYVLLSSQLSRIKICSEDKSVNVALCDSRGRVLFSETLYPFGGELTVYELDSLIESALRSDGSSFDVFTLRAGEDSHIFKVLLCSMAPLSDNMTGWLSENFLSTLNARRLSPTASLALFAFLQEDENAALSVSGRLKPLNGSNDWIYVSTVIDRDMTASYTGIRQFNIYVPDIAYALFKEAGVSADEYSLISFSVRCSQRSMECFIDDALSSECFYFRNCFGVWDLFSIPMVTVAKSVSELELARFSDMVLAYNRDVAKSYESHTAPLLLCEAEWIEQLFSSHEVLHMKVPSTRIADLTPVIITDSTCEVSSNPDEPDTASFVWQYDKTRPVMFPPKLPRIFSNHFDTRFL